MNIDQLFQYTTVERLQQYYIYTSEKLLKLYFPACSAACGEKIEQGFTIMDLTGGSMKVLNKRVYSII
jgi:hypothetical protein